MLEATVAAMERLGASRSRIVAAAGPMISQPNYEVGAELVERFVAADADNARFFAPGKPGHAMFDLPGYVAARLERLGLAAVDDLALCTYARPGAVLLLPPHHPPRRAGLRPARQRHRAGGLTAAILGRIEIRRGIVMTRTIAAPILVVLGALLLPHSRTPPRP